MPLIYRYIFFLIFFLSGCTLKPTSSSEVKVHFIAGSDINKNKKGEPSPVQLFIYQVNNQDNFSAENPLLLVSSSYTNTRHDYSRIAEIILQPGQHKTVSLPLKTGSNTFAFIAAFREMVNNQWSVVHTVENPPRFIWEKLFKGQPVPQYIRLQASTVALSEQGML